MLNFLNERKIIIISWVLIIVIVFGLLLLILKKPSKVLEEGIAREGLKSVVGEVDIRNAFIKVADSIGPAVVSISTERTERIKVDPFPFRGEQSPFQDEFFDRFFKDFFRDFPEEYERKQAGLGSGVIVDKEGYILTNEHVVSGAEKITVTLSDGRKLEGTVKGSDTRSDLAIIQINARNLPVAVLGNSDYIQTGEWVVAIGNPFGYLVDSPQPTVTAGVVSALHRSLPSQKSGYLDLIQTDAAINPGNSGGPLCDLEGKVIGINVAIFSTTGGYQGVGFAIPINLAKSVIGDLIKGKQIMYGWMGVVIQDMTEDLARYFGLPDQNGVLIAQVVENSPAYKAGLKEGDVIKKFDKKEIRSTKDIIMNVSRVPIGTKVEVSAVRDKNEMRFTVEIGRMPTEEELARLQGMVIEPKEGVATEKWRGTEVSPITEEVAMRFKIRDREGVLIINIEKNSPAASANLKPGDIVKRINNFVIKTIEDYKKAVKDLKGDVLIYTDRGFTIVREGK